MTETTHPTIADLTVAQITNIQRDMRLSDSQLAETLGFAPAAGERRIKRWKDGAEKPSGPAAKLLLLLHKLDTAMRVRDRGDPARALEIVQDAMPEVLQ